MVPVLKGLDQVNLVGVHTEAPHKLEQQHDLQLHKAQQVSDLAVPDPVDMVDTDKGQGPATGRQQDLDHR